MITILEFFNNLVSPFPIWSHFFFYYIVFYIFSFILLFVLRTIGIYLIFKSKDHYFNIVSDPLTMKTILLRSLFIAACFLFMVIIGYLQY